MVQALEVDVAGCDGERVAHIGVGNDVCERLAMLAAVWRVVDEVRSRGHLQRGVPLAHKVAVGGRHGVEREV